MEFVVSFMFLALLVAAVCYMFWSTTAALLNLFHHATGYYFKHLWYKAFTRKGLASNHRDILRNYFTYYRSLTPEDQWLFERRVKTFMYMKEFIVRTSEMTLTDEMKVLISACAVQLSFGYPGIFFRHFHRILIYPDDYYSTITRKYHQGEVNRGGIIVLSWKNFLSGYADESDGRNLGLHEMAHALLLEDVIMNGEFEFLDGEALDHWDRLAHEELLLIDRKESVFRTYGATNKHELFAVAVEVYFEQPRELMSYSRLWYETMSRLLNQDVLTLTSAR